MTMTKKASDSFFESIIPMLTTIIKGVIYKNNKPYLQPEVVLSEAYIYMSEKKVKTELDYQKLIIDFIKKNIGWQNSKLNKLEQVNNNLEFYSNSGDEDNDVSLNKAITETIEREDMQDVDLQHKINIEEWYNEKQCMLQMYRFQEKDKVKQIIFDLYFVKGLTKGVQLSKHLNVNKDYGCQYIRELKADIKQFNENYKKNINKN